MRFINSQRSKKNKSLILYNDQNCTFETDGTVVIFADLLLTVNDDKK